MKRVSKINETIKFNNTKIGGMKEIMVKAHALARMLRLPNESYAHAFRESLKTVWRHIRRADSMKKRVYIYFINGTYAFAETRMNISKACEYFCMIDETEKRCESAVYDIITDYTLKTAFPLQKEALQLSIVEYINAWLPQLIALENYNKNLIALDYTLDDDVRAFLANARYKTLFTTFQDVLVQFIYEFGFQTKCRLKNYVSSYGLECNK